MITAQQLRSFLYSREISPFNGDLIADRVYSLPARETVLHEYSMVLLCLQNYLNTRQWTAESNDCDDFARRDHRVS